MYVLLKDYRIVKANDCPMDYIKYALDIEDLFDEYIILRPEDKPYLADDDDLKLKYHVVTYGAIWTDKGLIYVAKMNKKGEFELL